MRYGKEVSQRILAIARAIQIVFLIAVFVLLAASTILIANTIRLSVLARRREIEVMKLVGASNWYVRGPFMLEGLLTGLVGSIAAVLLLFVSREIAIPQILGHIQDDAGRAGARVHVDGADPGRGRPRDRRARLGADAAALPPGLSRPCLPRGVSVVAVASDLERGREAYARRAWREAYDALSAADRAAPLEPADLELLATSAFMLGRDHEYVDVMERAHQAYLDAR